MFGAGGLISVTPSLPAPLSASNISPLAITTLMNYSPTLHLIHTLLILVSWIVSIPLFSPSIIYIFIAYWFYISQQENKLNKSSHDMLTVVQFLNLFSRASRESSDCNMRSLKTNMTEFSLEMIKLKHHLANILLLNLWLLFSGFDKEIMALPTLHYYFTNNRFYK